MSKSSKIKLFVTLLVLTVAWIVIVKSVDVANSGPNNTEIGLSSVNTGFRDLFFDKANEYFEQIYKITEYLGYLALLVCGCMGCVGLYQLIKRKSLLKVDRPIIVTGVLYVVTIGLYVLFEKVIINFRPVIMEGETEPEASFPSSHTMLIIVVMGSVVMLASYYFKQKNTVLCGVLCWIVQAVAVFLAVAMIAGRMICGVHWLTDIIGGVLISLTLLALYSIFYKE